MNTTIATSGIYVFSSSVNSLNTMNVGMVDSASGFYWHGVPLHWLVVASFLLNAMQLFVAMWEKKR